MEPFLQALLGSIAFALFLAAAITNGVDSRLDIGDRGTPRSI